MYKRLCTSGRCFFLNVKMKMFTRLEKTFVIVYAVIKNVAWNLEKVKYSIKSIEGKFFTLPRIHSITFSFCTCTMVWGIDPKLTAGPWLV